jgi:hypothetical protein
MTFSDWNARRRALEILMGNRVSGTFSDMTARVRQCCGSVAIARGTLAPHGNRRQSNMSV